MRTRPDGSRSQLPAKRTLPAEKPLYVQTNIERYEPKRVTLQSRALGTKLMRSERWAPEGDSKRRLRGLPYIMPSGHLSGSVKLLWRCSANQWFATVVRSVIERITKRAIVKRRCKYKTQRNLTEIAVYYVLTNDEYNLERLLCCRRSGFRGLIHKLTHVDDQMRFCFDQALNSALWLELRGLSPRTVHKNYIVETVYEPKVHSQSRQIRTYLNLLSDPWIVSKVGYTNGMCFLSPRGVRAHM